MPNEFEIHYYQSNTSLESLGMYGLNSFYIYCTALILFFIITHFTMTGYIDVRIITSVVADPTKKKDSKGYLFYITTPARVYNLAANTEKELNYWYLFSIKCYIFLAHVISGWMGLIIYSLIKRELQVWNCGKFKLVY